MATRKPAGAKKAAPVEAIEEVVVAPEPEPASLAGTPVDAVVPEEDYVPLGVAQADLGPDAEDADLVEGDAKDDSEAPLEPSDPETLVHDTTVGSSRPEDGA